jgi:hypothetical protein
MATGGCLCGAVRYEVRGPLRDVLICHCGECGSSLFWDPPRRDTISIAAGTLDGSTGLRVPGHWFVAQAGDYYELPDDGSDRHEASAEHELGGS